MLGSEDIMVSKKLSNSSFHRTHILKTYINSSISLMCVHGGVWGGGCVRFRQRAHYRQRLVVGGNMICARRPGRQ